MKSSEFHRLIRRNGWVCIRSNGSHYTYHKDGVNYSVPFHGGKEMFEMLRKRIVKDMKLKK
ncbi:type II toxin-antitoxin system HicA family toxin [Dyadobacter sp. CY343]|uniref:type II toxin-antitoxin system HicA family toxin n=1 Tax=Dyadobacter sp. CY343 TaxID=2907299 RepID=UPI0038D44EB5